MKKTIYFFAALSLVASTAMASKARLSALGAADNALTQNMTDVQSIFVNPADMHYVGDFATFEMGTKAGSALAAATSINPEGGFITSMGDSKFGFYLGRMSPDTNSFRGLMNVTLQVATLTDGTTLLSTENPIEIFYGSKSGDMSWGAGVVYTSSDKKALDRKQNALGIRMGVKTDDWAAFANVGLGATATDESKNEVKGTSALQIGGSYNIDNAKAYVQYQKAGAKATLGANGAAAFEADITETTIGFMNTFKKEASMAFYSIAYVMDQTEEKVADNKTVASSLPITMGAEIAAADWLKLRGSISQNVLVGSVKVGNGETDSSNHNTTTAAGAGFVWGRNNLDVVMTMGTDGSLDASTLGTNASYTYVF